MKSLFALAVLTIAAFPQTLTVKPPATLSITTAADGSVTIAIVTVPPPPPPPTGITVAPGVSIQSVVDKNPAGSTYTLLAGTHRNQTITPKNGDTFHGEAAGTTLSGSKTLTSWTTEGALWYAGGQTQQNPLSGGECDSTHPRCLYTEDLFMDGKPLLSAASKSGLAASSYYFDYTADKIYVAINPSGHALETSVTQYAFQGAATNVTIANLTIEHYASPAQRGVIGGPVDPPPAGWIIEDSTIRWNHGLAVKCGDHCQILRSLINDNGQMGINILNGSQQLVDHNEIARNNWAGYSMGWEAGGTKFWATTDLVVSNNNSHDNNGAGLWTDTNNLRTIYDSNTVERNLGAGISHEVSYDCTIRNNTVRDNNPTGSASWLWGAQLQLQNSRNCDVHDNVFVTAAANGKGVAVINQNRTDCSAAPCTSTGNYIHGNDVYARGTGNGGESGAVTDVNNASFWATGNNRFDYNRYHRPAQTSQAFAWGDGWGNFSWIQGKGQEAHGSMDSAPVPATASFTLPRKIM